MVAWKFENDIEGASTGLGNDTLEDTEFTASSMRCLCVMLWRECTMRRTAALPTGHPIRGVGAGKYGNRSLSHCSCPTALSRCRKGLCTLRT